MKYYRDYHIRRYGAHGTSHKFVGEKLADYIGRPFDDNWGLDDPTGKSDEDFIKVISFLNSI